MYLVSIEDALDHRHTEEFETLVEAQRCYQNYMEVGPEGYEIGVELEEVIGDYEDYKTLAEHEWFTLDEWELAHPWNDETKCHENMDW
tara:strand:- start:203 stop:466 length:264 start_codon:yes stop_codon:yes gene_type:complete